MKPEKQKIVNTIKATKKPEEIRKIFENPQTKDCLSLHSLGFPTYYRSIKALYPEYNPKTQNQMESLLKNIYQQYQDKQETETNTKAKIVIAILSDPKLYKECLQQEGFTEDVC